MNRLIIVGVASVALASCAKPIEVGPPPPPGSYMVCEALPSAPDLEPLEAIALPDGTMVYPKADVDTRDGSIARYIVDVRGAWFSCSNQLGRVRDYYAEQE